MNALDEAKFGITGKHIPPLLRRCQDISDPRHFGTIRLVPKCLDSSAPICLDLQQHFLLQ